LLNKVQTYAERFKSEGRPMVFLTDDAQLFITDNVAGDLIDKVAHSWPDLNMWLWLGAKSLMDFPGSVVAALMGDNTIENKILLSIDSLNTERLIGFGPFLSKSRQMIELALKELPKHNQDVLINAWGLSLFCRTLTALPLALSMNDGHEKQQRKNIMKNRCCTELQAALFMAEGQVAQAKVN
jgi:hypothetical protein